MSIIEEIDSDLYEFVKTKLKSYGLIGIGKDNKLIKSDPSDKTNGPKYISKLIADLDNTDHGNIEYIKLGKELAKDKGLAWDFLVSVLTAMNEEAAEARGPIANVPEGLKILWTYRCDPEIEYYTGKILAGKPGVLIVNTNNTTIHVGSKEDPDAILKPLGLSKNDFSDENVRSQFTQVWPEFDPYKPLIWQARREVTEAEMTHLNTYVPPAWTHFPLEGSDTPNPTGLPYIRPRMSWFIKLLIETLFPIAYERDYVLSWLKNALKNRNQTVLVLRGRRGIGKGMLHSLIVALIGPRYYDKATRANLNSFNSMWKNKRYVFLDEFQLDSASTIDDIKRSLDAEIQVNKKHVDAETVPNYANVVIASNATINLEISPQERRFSIPQLGEEDFKDVLQRYMKENGIEGDSEEILAKFSTQAFKEQSRDMDYSIEIAEFAQYLLHYESPNFPHGVSRPLRGPAFRKACAPRIAWKTEAHVFIRTCEELRKYPIPINPLFQQSFENWPKDLEAFGPKEWSLTKQLGSLKNAAKSFSKVLSSDIQMYLEDYKHLSIVPLGKIILLKDFPAFAEILSDRDAEMPAFLLNPEVIKLWEDPEAENGYY